MWPDHFYITGLFIPVYVVAYIPISILATGLVYWLLLRHLPWALLRGMFVFGLLTAIMSVPFWDVYAIGKEAGEVCREQAGLHVYSTAKVKGFLAAGGIKYWSKFGFTYVESSGKNKTRHTVQDGHEHIEIIEQFLSDYQLQTGVGEQVLSKHLERSSARVINRHTKEVLGDLVTVFIYPGRFDQVLLALTGTGSGFTPWSCGIEPPLGRSNKLNLTDLVLATLKPAN